MNEQEWLACTDPEPMLEFLRGKASERKLRLFFCACCRGKHYTICPQGLAAVTVAEAVADGLVEETLRGETERLIQSLISDDGSWSPYSLISWALHRPIGGSYPLDYVMMWAIPSVLQAHLAFSDEITSALSDIFGNPFNPVALEPSWLNPTVRSLAQAAYDNRNLPAGTLDNVRLAVLADALEEAGCDNADILNHLRQPGEHVRGCWVLDAILGKQ